MWIVKRQRDNRISTYRTALVLVAWFIYVLWRFTKPGIVTLERDPYY